MEVLTRRRSLVGTEETFCRHMWSGTVPALVVASCKTDGHSAAPSRGCYFQELEGRDGFVGSS